LDAEKRGRTLIKKGRDGVAAQSNWALNYQAMLAAPIGPVRFFDPRTQ
jgi:hypothetical protein